MDAETIITLLIFFGVFIWNLIAKMRESSQTGSPLPWPGQEEDDELLPDDLMEVPPAKQPAKPPPYLAREARMAQGQPKPVQPVTPVGSLSGQSLLEGKSVLSAQPRRAAPPPSVKKLQQAVVWAEILMPPVAIRERD